MTSSPISRDEVPAALRRASWITPLPAYAPLRNLHAQFVRDLDLPRQPRRAMLHVTADAWYAVWVNGVHVGRGPARGYQASWPFDTYDVAPHLRAGENRIAVHVHTPGRSTFRYVHQNAFGLLAALDLDDRAIITDAAWQCRVDPSRSRVTPQLSIQMEDQEHLDLRLGDGRWQRLGQALVDCEVTLPRGAVVDAVGTLAAERRWSPPRQARAYGAPPWESLEPRGLPHVSNGVRSYTTIRSFGRGHAALAARPIANPSADLFDLTDALEWHEVDAALDGPVTLPALAEGEWHAIVLDAGEATLGTLCVNIREGRSGDAIGLVPFEAIDDRGRPILPDPAGECRVALAARVVLHEGGAAFETMSAFGHRRLALVTRGPCAATRLDVRVRETLYPVETAGSFVCGDDALNDIVAVCERTQRVNMTDAYIDAWREQAQWWGDVQVQYRNHQQLACDDRLLRRGLAQISRQRLANGLTYGHAPTAAHTCVLPDFALVWLLTLHDHWQHTGSLDLAREHADGVARTLDYFQGADRDPRGLLVHDPRYWLFLDWADVPKAGSPALLSLLYLRALRRTAELYEAAGDRELAKRARDAEQATAAAVAAGLYDAQRGLYCDGIGVAGERRATFGVHAQAMAVLADLPATPDMRRAIADALAVRCHEPTQPSCFWITHVFEAATRLGLRELVVACIRERWAEMVRQGSTFEVWHPAPGESRSHAWSAHPMVHLPRLIAGVERLSSGFSRVRIRPMLCDTALLPFRFDLPVPQGVLTVEAACTPGGVRLDVALPATVSAEIILDDQRHKLRGPQRKGWQLHAKSCRAVGVAATKTA